MLEHACQQRLVVECRNRNNGMDPLIGTLVVASAHELMMVCLLACLPDAPRGNDASSKKTTTNPT
jgi:hypothetical protein